MKETSDTTDVEARIEALEEERLVCEGHLAEAYRRREYKRGEKLSQQLKNIEVMIEELYKTL
jgi:hypothetical protein